MISIHEEIDVRMDDLGQFEELLPLTKFRHRELSAFNFLKSSNTWFSTPIVLLVHEKHSQFSVFSVNNNVYRFRVYKHGGNQFAVTQKLYQDNILNSLKPYLTTNSKVYLINVENVEFFLDALNKTNTAKLINKALFKQRLLGE